MNIIRVELATSFGRGRKGRRFDVSVGLGCFCLLSC